MTIKLFIPGNPIPWKAHAGFGRNSFNPRYKEKEYYQYVIKQQYGRDLLEGAIAVDYIFQMAIPRSISKKKRTAMVNLEILPTHRPDRDNLAKFLSDCLQGIVFKDDSQIVDGRIQKLYSEEPGTVIKILSLF